MSNEIEKRMAELMVPIDQQILMCDDDQDQLMFACAMMQRAKEIFDLQLGDDARRKMFKDFTE
jgi:hypothetical protein